MQGNRPKIEFDAEKHIYRVNGVRMPSVTEILEPITAKKYGEISQEVLRMAADRGTIVHEACEAIDYGLEAEVPVEYEGYVNAYLAFLDDYRPDWMGIEQMIHSREDGYCGTVDRWGMMLGEEWVVDIKTTTAPTKRNKMSGCCQTVAYANALKTPKKRGLLYLKKTGEYSFVDCEKWSEKHHFNEQKAWQICLELQRVIGGA